MITLDFETYYAKDFSLSKMTTEAYINDPRFEVIGVSVKEDEGEIEWITGDDEAIRSALLAHGVDKKPVCCHNAAFDCAILSWRYGIRPPVIVDTLSMARPVMGLTSSVSLRTLADHYGLGQKGTEIYNTLGRHRVDFTPEELAAFGDYCKQDVNLTYKLYKILAKVTPLREVYLIDLTLRMFTEPKIKLDLPLLTKHLDEVRAHKQALMESIGLDSRERIMSNPKFADMLRELGVEPPMKVSPTTGKQTYAFAKTDDGFKALLEHPDERVQTLAAARLGLKSTIEETRTEMFIGIAKRMGVMPVMLNYYGAVNTGRFCLTGDTIIKVRRSGRDMDIRLDTLRPDDLVWDGEEYVTHGGLVCRGPKEVMTYDGITGTPDHRVFAEEGNETGGTITLFEASFRGYPIQTAGVAPSEGEQADSADPIGADHGEADEGRVSVRLRESR